MPLSEEELRLLEQMERALVEEDPKLASTLRGTSFQRAARRRMILGGAILLVGIGLLIVAVLLDLTAVLQTVVGLLEAGCRVYVVGDAVGSRRAENREAALGRMAAHGAEIVTTEMVVFEWLDTARHPRFREVVKLIK